MAIVTKILIANRGEIACRVIRTARRMNIRTVAIYSDADKNALHVRDADEAVHIGPSAANESYLVVEKIIEACRSTGADAVHPGYGFLSENPAFVRACTAAGITFIGPSAESMEAMGLKDAAKKRMDAASVPTTPGYHGKAQDLNTLQSEAKKIGYPVLIKAVAGGGGKGMRKVDSAKEFEAALASCQREAASSFGDDRVLIEKYITSPRHIEVQVFGDTHGNVIHAFERDCSIQRRHQKVLEEAPAPGMTSKVRAAMTEAAVKAAKAVDYVGAGTVEFIVDGSGPLRKDGFWFMEMNTRLQVEHPVTEMITGLDLVEWQIRVARGEALPSQDEITLTGHAVEARIYAEDPEADFLPSVGALDILRLPKAHRIDTGVEQGGEVSIYYDPMIAKMIVHSGNRHTALAELDGLCRETCVYPVKSNARFLAACLSHQEFIEGDVSTNFIAQNETVLFAGATANKEIDSLAAALLPKNTEAAFDCTSGWRMNLPPRTHFTRSHNGEDIALPLRPNVKKIKKHVTRYTHLNGEIVFIDGKAFLIEPLTKSDAVIGGGNMISAPMPGKIISVNVSSGEKVAKGDALIVVEAMKMEMTLPAPRDGVVETVNVLPGALVADDEILLTLKEISQ